QVARPRAPLLQRIEDGPRRDLQLFVARDVHVTLLAIRAAPRDRAAWTGAGSRRGASAPGRAWWADPTGPTTAPRPCRPAPWSSSPRRAARPRGAARSRS